MARTRKTTRRAAGAVLAGLLLAGFAPGTAPAGPGREVARRDRNVFFQDESRALTGYDRRAGGVAPTARARAIVQGLGGTARWNSFGTPISLIDYGGVLDAGLGGPPAEAARAWIATHRNLFRLGAADLDGLALQHVLPLGPRAHSVQFRQTYRGIPAAVDGRITLGIARGRVVYVSSSAAPGSGFVSEPALTPARALLEAAADVDFEIAAVDLSAARRDDDWNVFDIATLSEPGRARLRALPTPRDGVRLVYETLLIDNDHAHGHPEAWVHYIDALTGKPWRRESRIDFERDAEAPFWRVFPNTPPLRYEQSGGRVLWCWEGAEDCERGVRNRAAMGPWDSIPRADASTFTTSGNSARAAQSWVSPYTPGEQYQPVSTAREYDFEFTNQWYESGCDPASFATPQRLDVDAATVNLFAMHNRMHDWSYELGFTEEAYNLQAVHREESPGAGRPGDPEVGNSQAGGALGSISPAVGRDNANQITPPDGVAPITNMYLWQPVGAAFYPPCVDGDFDMAVIGHEYSHAISNRMVGGPDLGLEGAQADAMGESWSDLFAVEYLNEYAFAPVGGENPFSVGAYVTGNHESAIRNYGMNRSPLNYSDVAYDIAGAQVHADGEIWSAINFDIRSALNRRYDDEFPSSDARLQRSCADGDVPASRCPGNRRWVQIAFDAFLLMESEVSMVEARDAYLAADKARFDGANQDLLWEEFARGGLGKEATSAGTDDAQPKPSFENPRGPDGEVTFRLVAPGPEDPEGFIYVGDYEARVTPIVSGSRGTAVMTPGSYEFVTQAPGFGMKRFSMSVQAGAQTVIVKMDRNLASAENGAKAEGDGQGQGALIDDTEATNWTSAEGPVVEGKQVTVDLAGGEHLVDRVNVSAMLVPQPLLAPGQNRFSALRRFAIEVCRGTCDARRDFARVYTSPRNAFPARPPRPKAPNLILRTFDIPDVRATHVRLVVLTNQCTGVRAFNTESDNDPKESTCLAGTPPSIPGQGNIVRAAELQVFGR